MKKKTQPGPKGRGSEQPANDRSRRPELEGADSMLRCYNATAWRLEDWLADDQPPAPAPSLRKKSPPAQPRSPVVK